jgi:Peptidase_C39 like family
MFKKFKILFLFTILIILGSVFFNNRVVIKEYFTEPERIELPVEVKFEDIVKESDNEEVEQEMITKQESKIEEVEIVEPVVSEINLAVPFTIQSPNQKWDEPYKEGCEEASILMVQAFLDDEQITISSALKDIQVMVDWQMEEYNGHFDLPASTTVQMARDFLNLNAEIIHLESVEDIKKIIRTGYPLILPTAGRELGNPNFTGMGPLYHMLVVKGFQHNLIITNDPGTRKGENYVYNENVLWNAIADWDEEIKNPDQSKKVGIIIK